MNQPLKRHQAIGRVIALVLIGQHLPGGFQHYAGHFLCLQGHRAVIITAIHPASNLAIAGMKEKMKMGCDHHIASCSR